MIHSWQWNHQSIKEIFLLNFLMILWNTFIFLRRILNRFIDGAADCLEQFALFFVNHEFLVVPMPRIDYWNKKFIFWKMGPNTSWDYPTCTIVGFSNSQDLIFLSIYNVDKFAIEILEFPGIIWFPKAFLVYQTRAIQFPKLT